MGAQSPEVRRPATDGEAAARRPPVAWGRLLAVGAGAVVATTIVNVLLALVLASALQVPAEFSPLRAVAVVTVTVVGVAGAVLVFALITRVAADPVPTFRRVAAVALLISWVPDLLIWTTHAFPGTTTGGMLSLMSLHVVAAGLAFLLLTRFGVSRG